MSENHRRALLVRHGETRWSRERRHTGLTDVLLLPEGEDQARRLAKRLAPYRGAMVLTSPLRRARDTCYLIGLGEQAVVDQDLCEWDYGAYEGLTTAEIRLERPDWTLFDDGALGGESADEVGRRADRVIERIRAASGDVVCIAHAHVLRVLGARWIGMAPVGGRHLQLSPCSVSELGWEREEPVIASWNTL